MKKLLLLFFTISSLSVSNAQTGIGTTTPNASAKLDVYSTNKGFLPPRVTLTSVTDAATIPSPATGLLVYNTGTNVNLAAGYYYWNGSNWATIATASSPNQTVDYVSVTRTTLQTVSVGDNILFNQVNGGTIPYNSTTGLFTLTAGKTYRLTGCIAISSSNASAEEVNVVWKNANGDLLPNKGEILSTNFGTTGFANGISDVIYTPSANTTVSLTVAYSSGSVVLWGNFTYANIQQIGSSAIVNPWVLNGNDVYNTSGNVGIGTSSPSASALLDITSTSKGLLPPRVALTAKSGNTTPIASPTTGLIVYNTASAGTGGDAVTPGYYYFNGTIWTRMDPEGWSTGVSITFGATTTAPTKGTPSIDYVKYRNIGGKEYEVEYNYLQTTAGTAGSGDYLFTLPSGLQFDLTVPGQIAYTGAAGYNGMKNRIASSQGDLIVSGFHSSSIAIPYDSTRFRIMNNNWGNNTWLIHSPSNYAISDGTYGMKMTFKFKAL